MAYTHEKSGGALIAALVIVIAIATLSAGLLKLYERDAVDAVYAEQKEQAFWLAESGMQRALHMLRTDKIYRDNPYALNESVGNGSFDADVEQMSMFSNRWSIVSTGSVHGVSRALKLTPLLTAEVGYALMSLSGDSKLDKDGTINDDVYSYGKITVNGRSTPTINGEVQSLDTRNLDYTELTADDRVEMEIDASDFDLFPSDYDVPSYTNVAVITGGVTNMVSYLDLTGDKPVYSAGDLELENGTFGDGTLVVNGTLKFKNSGDPFVVANDGDIYVNGDIWAGKEGTFGERVVVYATGNMSLQKAAGSDSTTFLIEGNLTVNMDLNFNGLIFAEGSVTVDGNMDLNGSLIAGDGFWLKGGYTVSYDGSQIPSYILENMIVYVPYAAKPGTWTEIPVS